MPRVTEAEVRAVLETDEEVSLTGFISDAGVFVDRAVLQAQSNSAEITSQEAKLMEKYIAAHLYALFEQKPLKERVGRSSVTYVGKSGMGLESTVWGQTALSIDSTGSLATVTGTETDNVKTLGGAYLGEE